MSQLWFLWTGFFLFLGFTLISWYHIKIPYGGLHDPAWPGQCLTLQFCLPPLCHQSLCPSATEAFHEFLGYTKIFPQHCAFTFLFFFLEHFFPGSSHSQPLLILQMTTPSKAAALAPLFSITAPCFFLPQNSLWPICALSSHLFVHCVPYQKTCLGHWYFQHPGESLAHKRPSINTCSINAIMYAAFQEDADHSVPTKQLRRKGSRNPDNEKLVEEPKMCSLRRFRLT